MKFQIVSFIASLALITQVLAVPQDAASPVPTCVLHCELPIILSIASRNKYIEQAVVHTYVPSFNVLYIIDTYWLDADGKNLSCAWFSSSTIQN